MSIVYLVFLQTGTKKFDPILKKLDQFLQIIDKSLYEISKSLYWSWFNNFVNIKNNNRINIKLII